MDSKSRVVSIIFTLAKIAGALGAFFCAMVVGAPWKMVIAAAFNVVQLIVLFYAVVMLVSRMGNTPEINLWKAENVASMVLASSEFAVASVWAMYIPENSPAQTNAIDMLGYINEQLKNALREEMPILRDIFNYVTGHVTSSYYIATTTTIPVMKAMVALGYITGIICLSHAVYVVLTNNNNNNNNTLQ